jgi:hypothetical protein
MGQKYYSLAHILNRQAHYNIIFGERSNGKSFAVLLHGLKKYLKTGEQMAIVRRWSEDFTGKRGQQMFSAIVSAGYISKLSDGKYNGIYYYSSRWFLCSYSEDGKREQDEKPFAYGFSISAGEHDKSSNYPEITTILFDEFLTRRGYLPDEFVLFMNTISTIIRGRKNVTIFMLGNTVNKYCPYFKEMGLLHIPKMRPGDIDVYKYGDSGLRVAVEYTAPTERGKNSDIYFAFDNPKLSMITGGEWEIDIYPHLPVKYSPKDILFIYFIQFNENILQCEIIQKDDMCFTFIHRKTTDLKLKDTDIIYSTVFNADARYKRKITKPDDKISKKIAEFFVRDKVFYADNEIGEIVRNYLIWCRGGG